MQIHELPEVSAIGSGGYFATDNGSQTTKIDYDALARAIIEQYNASTLAGSAQSVKTALDGIGNASTLLSFQNATAIPSGSDLNDYTSVGEFYADSNNIASSLSNCPISYAFKMTVEATNSIKSTSGTGRIQRLYHWNNLEVYQRRFGASAGWGAWEKAPTRAELNDLNSNIGNFSLIREGAVTAGTYTYQLEHSHVYLVTVVRASSLEDSSHGMYIVASWNGSGAVSTVKASTGATVSQEKTTLTITTTKTQMTISIMRIA